MADWVSDTDLVHLLLDAVALMDLSAFEEHHRKGGVGAPSFAPRMMVCILLYAYSNGHRSSRKIERLCERDAGFRMIVGSEVPDHSVIARFRKRRRDDLETVFLEVLKLCHAAGLVRLGLVALDGTKVKANASLAANRTLKTVEAEVSNMLAEAEATDAAEDEKHGDGREGGLPADLRDPSDRMSRLRACQERLSREAEEKRAGQRAKIDARAAGEAAGGKKKRGRKPKSPDDVVPKDAKANVTDPDSRVMKSRKGYLQGYNAQAVVTDDQIILAADVTHEANDVRQLTPMMARTRALMEKVTGAPVTLGVGLFDAGYWSDKNAATRTADCEYLIATTKDWKRRKALRDAPPPRGRMPKDMDNRAKMERKLLTKRGRALYRLRGQTVEPVFGQMKENQGADAFMMRGASETKGEWNLHCAAHNIKKLHSESVRRGRKGAKWLLN